MKNTTTAIIFALLAWTIPWNLQAKDSTQVIYSPYVDDNFPNNVYWGDTHLHTSLSFDAYGDGNTKMDSDVAYDFARGKVIKGHDGVPVRISRPIDFIVIADHAEYMGVVQGVNTGDKLLQATEPGARWSKMAQEGNILQVFGEMVNDGATNQPRQLSDEFTQSVWAKVIDYAEQYNDPGVFTAFIGYEYSSLPDGGDNLHRVVMFRDGAEKTSQVVPFSLFDGENPEELWDYFARYEKQNRGPGFLHPP